MKTSNNPAYESRPGTGSRNPAGPVCLLLLLCSFPSQGSAQRKANQDEDKVPPYTLPELLVTDAGQRVTTVTAWENIRRPEIRKKFGEHVYGRIPQKPAGMHFKTIRTNRRALNGKATRKEVTICLTPGTDGPAVHLLLYLPNHVKGRAPVMLGLNFMGNHTVEADTAITITDNWRQANWQKLYPWHTPARGEQTESWSVAEIIDSGYALATAWYGDVEQDRVDGWKEGVRGLLQDQLGIRPEEWSAISAWAWELSRIMDYLETEPRVNKEQVVVTGHSRLGKTALWAGANDQRFAVIVSNNSGEGGAALARRDFGETVALINTSFPHWFIPAYKTYNDNVSQLPVDQHMLLALAAPRPLYVASASLDLWADPKGEFLSAKHAGAAYALYGKNGVQAAEMPLPDTPVGETIGYHIRSGEHNLLPYDWRSFIRFCNRHFGLPPSGRQTPR